MKANNAVRSVSRSVALACLALLPAYCSLEGLVTGDTRAIAKHTYSHDGAAGIVTAIGYGLFATALLIAAARFLSANAKRRAILFKWGSNVMILGVIFYISGRLLWVAQ